MRIAEVAFPVPLPKTFHYRVPEGMRRLEPGERVRASFGPRRATGTVLAVFEGEPSRPLKDLESRVDDHPALSAESLACARFLSQRFGAPIGEALKAFLPSYIKTLDEAVSLPSRPPFAAQPHASFVLTPGQEAALHRLDQLLDARRFVSAVVFGVPASGKTEVYLRLIRRAVIGGGQALFLLPEITLTRPFFDEFAVSLDVAVVLWHSRMTQAERRRAWLAVQRGAAKVVVGARSAVLLPFKDMRLIVLDEEQDESFKQDAPAPAYHARDIALERARAFNALAVLGSATPSIEAWDMVRRGQAELISLPERVSVLPRPLVRVLAPPRFGEAVSEELLQAVAERLSRREQSILLINRRGFATLTACHKCRWIDRCRDCGVAKIRHQNGAGWVLICHHCGKTAPPPERCARCGEAAMRVSGVGTQKVAAELKTRLPGARILRMDRDTVSKEGRQEQKIYDKFLRGEADILVGTKLVAKSFHFPNVTLVGVVDADSMLHRPDFRSAERTMQLLYQVAGRSGRADKPGEVVLQSLSSDHPAVSGAVSGDYAAWADAELSARQELHYPPAGALVRAVVAAKDSAKAESTANSLAEALRALPQFEVVGPAPALLREVRGRFRWQLLVKLAPEQVESCLVAARAWPVPSSVRLSLDPDPYDFL